MMAFGLIPAPTKYSTRHVLNLVYPVLKSSPATNTPCFSANSITPGTIVFYGDPLMNEHPSRTAAHANTVEALISGWLDSIDFNNFSAVPWMFGSSTQNLSVLAVHKRITLSRLLVYLKSAMFLRIAVKCSNLLLPGITLSALSP